MPSVLAAASVLGICCLLQPAKDVTFSQQRQCVVGQSLHTCWRMGGSSITSWHGWEAGGLDTGGEDQGFCVLTKTGQVEVLCLIALVDCP